MLVRRLWLCLLLLCSFVIFMKSFSYLPVNRGNASDVRCFQTALKWLKVGGIIVNFVQAQNNLSERSGEELSKGAEVWYRTSSVQCFIRSMKYWMIQVSKHILQSNVPHTITSTSQEKLEEHDKGSDLQNFPGLNEFKEPWTDRGPTSTPQTQNCYYSGARRPSQVPRPSPDRSDLLHWHEVDQSNIRQAGLMLWLMNVGLGTLLVFSSSPQYLPTYKFDLFTSNL